MKKEVKEEVKEEKWALSSNVHVRYVLLIE